MISTVAVDYLGPKWTMIVGLLGQALVGFILSGTYTRLKESVVCLSLRLRREHSDIVSAGWLYYRFALQLISSESTQSDCHALAVYGIYLAFGEFGGSGECQQAPLIRKLQVRATI
jgi:hypothetical protein